MKKINALIIMLIIAVLANPAGMAQITENTGKDPCIPCGELKNLKLPDVTISETEVVEEGEPYCKVSGTIGKEINSVQIEI